LRRRPALARERSIQIGAIRGQLQSLTGPCSQELQHALPPSMSTTHAERKAAHAVHVPRMRITSLLDSSGEVANSAM
jgi:hypothetical protein